MAAASTSALDLMNEPKKEPQIIQEIAPTKIEIVEVHIHEHHHHHYHYKDEINDKEEPKSD